MAVGPPPDEPGAHGGPNAGEPLTEGECPRCGTPFAGDQEYCLECGLRLPAAHGLIGVLRTAWTRRLHWYPGDWVWPSLLGLVVAVLGAAGAIYYVSRDEGSAQPTLIGTSPPGSVTGTTPSLPPEQTTIAPTNPPTTGAQPQPPPPPPPPPPRDRVIGWPSGVNGYTLVLTSIPVSSGRSAAEAQARRALRAGLAKVGVLNSAQYSSLHPGYYVVFSGVYDSNAAAQAQVGAAHARGYPSAYPRRITP